MLRESDCTSAPLSLVRPAGKLDRESQLFHWPLAVPPSKLQRHEIHRYRSFRKLKRHPKRKVFPEGTEPRVLRAAARFVKLQLGAPIALGAKEEVERVAREHQIDLDTLAIIDPRKANDLPIFIQRLKS
jgi:hypothetical protein